MKCDKIQIEEVAYMNIDERNIEVIDERMAHVLRQKTPQERLMIAFKMWDYAKSQLTDYLHSKYPDMDEEKIRLEVIKRLSHGNI